MPSIPKGRRPGHGPGACRAGPPAGPRRSRRSPNRAAWPGIWPVWRASFTFRPFSVWTRRPPKCCPLPNPSPWMPPLAAPSTPAASPSYWSIKDAPRNLMAGSRVYQLLDERRRSISSPEPAQPGQPLISGPTIVAPFTTSPASAMKKPCTKCSGSANGTISRNARASSYAGPIPMQWWILNLDDGFQ
jgi:hypothetical protein